jgi:hypothetical protein
MQEENFMTDEQWRKSMITYLMLKGTWGMFATELHDLVDYSGQDVNFCAEVIKWCDENKKIKLFNPFSNMNVWVKDPTRTFKLVPKPSI